MEPSPLQNAIRESEDHFDDREACGVDNHWQDDCYGDAESIAEHVVEDELQMQVNRKLHNPDVED